MQRIQMFPFEAGISEMRAVVDIAKDSRNHTISLSELEQITHRKVDKLLPVVGAGIMLGFMTVNRGKLKLTKLGAKMHPDNFQALIRTYITRLEPFRLAKAALQMHKSESTRQLSFYLRHNKLAFSTNERENEEILRHVLLEWALRCKIFNYNPRSDRWRLS